MSKQYLTVHNIDSAHPTDIFSLAPTPTALLSASGSSSILVHSTQSPDFPVQQTLENAHKLGCHHLATSEDGKIAASAGFGGEIKIWSCDTESTDPSWSETGKLPISKSAGEAWAISLDTAGRYLATSSYDGRIGVWDLSTGPEAWAKVREYETKGSFGLCVAMSADQKLTASGHENGSVYVFSNEVGKLAHSLQGLVKPVRSVAFSPLGTLLAAGGMFFLCPLSAFVGADVLTTSATGDSLLITLYSTSSGEALANLAGHNAWVTSLSFNHSGEYLLSGDFSGKCKVWSVETRNCVATHGESDKGIWSVRWLPKNTTQREGAVGGRSEMFAVAGASRGIGVWREASGG
jgi:superkiller protein 8